MSVKPNGSFIWADLTAADQARAVSFYSELLGWTVEAGGPEFAGYGRAYVGTPGPGTSVAGIGPSFGAPSAWRSYFMTDDIEATIASISELGGSVPEAMPGMTIMDLPELGRMAVAYDPTGAPFGLWQPQGMDGFDLFAVPGSFGWTEVYSSDAAKSRDFFAALFGYSVTTLSETEQFTYYQLSLPGGSAPTLGVMQDSPDGPSSFGHYIMVENADEAAEKAVALGATKGRGPEDTPFGRLVELTDTEGAAIKLMGTNRG